MRKKGDPLLVHQARVATRRLREALPLVASGPRGRKLERRVRRLTRALGPVRELDVALEMLETLTGGRRRAAGRRRQAAAGGSRRTSAHAHRDVHAGRPRRHRQAAASRRDRGHARAPGPRRDPKRVAAAQARAARRAVRLREAIENAAGLYLPDRLHEVRIAVKKLRYAMEVSRELSGSRATARIRTLKEAQDLLGRMHDHEVLIARVRGVQGSKAPNLRLSGRSR